MVDDALSVYKKPKTAHCLAGKQKVKNKKVGTEMRKMKREKKAYKKKDLRPETGEHHLTAARKREMTGGGRRRANGLSVTQTVG